MGPYEGGMAEVDRKMTQPMFASSHNVFTSSLVPCPHLAFITLGASQFQAHRTQLPVTCDAESNGKVSKGAGDKANQVHHNISYFS